MHAAPFECYVCQERANPGNLPKHPFRHVLLDNGMTDLVVGVLLSPPVNTSIL